MRYVGLIGLALLFTGGCQSRPVERTEFAKGLRFRYAVPNDDHFFEVRSIERAPRIRAFVVRAFEDQNGDGQRQSPEPHVTYQQDLTRPSAFVTMTFPSAGSSWDPVIYEASVTTESGRVEHSWRVSEADVRD